MNRSKCLNNFKNFVLIAICRQYDFEIYHIVEVI